MTTTEFDTPEAEKKLEAQAQTVLTAIRDALATIPAKQTTAITKAYDVYASLGGYNEAIFEDFEKIFAKYIDPLTEAVSADEEALGGWSP